MPDHRARGTSFAATLKEGGDVEHREMLDVDVVGAGTAGGNVAGSGREIGACYD